MKQISKNLQAILMSSLVVTVIISAAVVLATDIGADTIQVGDDGTAGKLTLYSEQGGTDYELTLEPNGAMTQDTTYTFPADDGDNGEVLTTDGAGALDWLAAGGDFADGGEAGGADRTLGNTDDFTLGLLQNNLVRMTIGRDGADRPAIGFGVAVPRYLLDLLRANGELIRGYADGGDTEFEVFGYNLDSFLRLANDDGLAVFKFGSQEAADMGWALIGRNSNKDYRMDIASNVDLSENSDDKGDTKISIAQDGKVGLGIKNPKAELDVDGGIKLVPKDAVKPACDNQHRGELWFTDGGGGKDTLELCARGGGGNFNWRTLW